jgi:hypothetical protein
LLFVQ